MAIIEGIWIQNYRVLKDITLGRLPFMRQTQPLTPVTAVIGKNGVGKSCLFDAFGFLSECLKWGVEEACDARGRGGFERVRSQGSDDPIRFQVCYKEEPQAQPITYGLLIHKDDSDRPYVEYEFLHQRDETQGDGRSFLVFSMIEGQGHAWKGYAQGQEVDANDPLLSDFQVFLAQVEKQKSNKNRELERIELQDKRKLGIATLGALKQHPRIASRIPSSFT